MTNIVCQVSDEHQQMGLTDDRLAVQHQALVLLQPGHQAASRRQCDVEPHHLHVSYQSYEGGHILPWVFIFLQGWGVEFGL